MLGKSWRTLAVIGCDAIYIKAGSHREDCKRLEAYATCLCSGLLRQGKIMNHKKCRKMFFKQM